MHPLARNIIALIAWIALSFVPAIIGSQYTPGEWYRTLSKPSWTPPGFLFGPVWTFLYASMGVAAWLVWRRAGLSAAGPALVLFIAQLILNGAWSWIFFGLHKPGMAFAEILLLWAAILGTLITFWDRQVMAGVLFIPYLAWVSFAAVLNFTIWRLNI